MKRLMIVAGLLALATTAVADRQYVLCDPLRSKFCSGLVALYDFDEDSNNARTSETRTAPFYESNGQSNSRVSGLLGANGGVAYAVSVASVNQSIMLKETVGLSGTFTANLWVKLPSSNVLTSSGDFADVIFTRDTYVGNHNYPKLSLYNVSGTLKWRFQVKQSMTDTVSYVEQSVSKDTIWHLVSWGQYPSPTSSYPYQMTIWISVDGTAKTTATTTYPSVPAPGDVYLGENLNSGAEEFTAMHFDQLSIFSWTFSNGDLSTFFNNRAGRAHPFDIYAY